MKIRKGINVRKWCLAHEEYIDEKLAADISAAEISEVAKLHEKKLAWLMHERLIHLIVMTLTAILVMFAMALMAFLSETLTMSGALFLIAFILLVFYVRHYFFLENTVQSWYLISEELIKRSNAQ